MISMQGPVADFERSIMLERQNDGIGEAKHSGDRFGRPGAFKIKHKRRMRKAAGAFGTANTPTDKCSCHLDTQKRPAQISLNRP